jgi:hypothetical protein
MLESNRPRGRRTRMSQVRMGLAVAALTGVFLMCAGTDAFAGSGDFCTYYDLNPGAACYGEYHASNSEVEGWNSDAKGVGSCAGVYNGSVKGEACVGDASGYDEVYCTASCSGKAGDPFVEDNSPYNSVFTGWASW